MSARLGSLPVPRLDDVKFQFGLDLITPSKDTAPGSFRSAQNWEININGGVTTVAGYERYDGQDKPSSASYTRLDVTITGSIDVGDTVTGATSNATGVVVAKSTDGAQTYLVLTKVTGTFNSSENLEVSAAVEGNTDSEPAPGSAPTKKLDAQYRNLAADEYRSDITSVGDTSGSGSVLGVIKYNGVVYAFRNNAGGTAATLWKSSSSGWTSVALGRELAFTSGGTTEIEEGDTITGATSGATAVITRVVLESGSWAAGTAAGRFIFASQTLTFQAENVDVGAAPNLATIAGDSSAITLQPDGRFELTIHNFGGQAGTSRVYGADGVNRAFEFDGTVFTPISTGMTTDTPVHIAAHKNHLFLSFDGSAQHSGTGFPYVFSPIFGADELAVGDDITAFVKQPGSQGNAALGIFTKNKIYVLYGTSSADWELVEYRDEIGAYPYSVQEFGMTVFMDDKGIANLLTSQQYGNFAHNILSRLIQPWLNARRSTVKASTIVRDKSQLRMFFSDGSSLYATTDNRKILGFMPVVLGHTVNCIHSSEATDGTEEIFFGSTNGYVFQMERGTSFDGAAIEAYILTHYLHNGSYQIEKGYSAARFEITGSGYSEFQFGYSLGYGDSVIPQPENTTIEAAFSVVQWDSFTWDDFTWDGQILKPERADLEGDAENISLIFRTNADYFSPLTISGSQIRLIDQKQLI